MSTNNNVTTDENKPKLSEEQKKKMKKYAVYALMGVICALCMWFIFAPSAKDKAKQEQTAGFNTDIPLPKEKGIIGDKRDAYEQELMKQKQSERMRSLSDFSSMLGAETEKSAGDLPLSGDESQKKKTSSATAAKNNSGSPIGNSANAYRDVNRSLGNFYEKPKVDPEKEQLKKELEDLKAKTGESESRKNEEDKQLALMEKSFQMAAKYMPGTAAATGTPPLSASEPAKAQEKGSTKENASDKAAAIPVTQVRTQTVSLLQPEMTSAEFIETYSKERNMGFITVKDEANTDIKNTVAACVHGNQTVTDGQNVRLRLLEAVRAGKTVIPPNTLVSGTAKIQGERLAVTVSYMEYGGAILPTLMTVYDIDGMPGIFIPNMQELSAAKEIVANMGTSAGTSINLSTNAGEQFAADMGRNLIQGASQFLSKKLREVKVNLKSGYKVFLLSEESIKKNQPQFAAK